MPEDWRPIDTAPKDGTSVLVYWTDGMTDGYASIAFYDDGISGEDSIGWWSYRNSVGQEQVAPTHWLPFEPPQENGEKPDA